MLIALLLSLPMQTLPAQTPEPAPVCAHVIAQAARRTALDAWLQLERLPGVAVATGARQIPVLRGGRVERIAVAMGERVRAGQLLAEVMSEPLQRERTAADAALAVSEGDWSAQRAEVARLERGRDRRQARPQLFAREDSEAHDALLQSARARLAAADARRVEAQQRRDALEREFAAQRVLAPSDGVVTRLHARTGSVLAEGAPLLDLQGDAALVFRFALPASRAGSLRTGDALCVVAADGSGAPVPARLRRHAAGLIEAAQVVIAEAEPESASVPGWHGLAIDVLPRTTAAR